MSLRRSLALAVAIVIAALTFFASPASAVDSPGYTAPPPSEPVTSTVPQVTSRRATPTVTERRQSLPITGSDMAVMASVGVVLVAGGAGLIRIRQRSAASA